MVGKGAVVPLSDRVYRDLACRIRTCELRPGQMLSETDLAERYEVSKTPVREALQRLINEGVIAKYARAGYMVKPIGVNDVLDGYRVRALLEGEAAALAAGAMGPEQIGQLEALLPDPDEIDQQAPEIPAYQNTNRDFHLIIAGAARSERLAELVRVVYDDMQRVTAMDPFLRRWTPDGYREHWRIVEALRSRDPEAARRAATAHIEAGLARVLSRL